MFGLVCLLWVLSCFFAGLSFVHGRSACRHAKRAEVYRKQIEELQVEVAGLKKAVQHYRSFDYRKYKPDMVDALLMAMAGAEVEAKYKKE